MVATIDEAAIRKQSWKSDAMRNYAVALVKAGLAKAFDIMPAVNNDDVPDEYQPNDRTTVGAVFRMLIAAGVIVPFRGTVAAMGIYGGMRPSSRSVNNGHRNQLYTLTNIYIAREWLERHGAELPNRPRQLEMFA